MRRVRWPLALLAMFALGLVAGAAIRGRSAGERLQREIATLEAALQSWGHARPSSGSTTAVPGSPSPDEGAVVAFMEDFETSGRPARHAGPVPPGPTVEGPQAPPAVARPSAGPPKTVQMALERFRRYFETLNGPDAQDRAQRLQEVLEELRGLGDVGGQALMRVLASGADSDQRRVAARLLGHLQIPAALPLLRDIIQREEDVLLRRAAATGLRQLQTPESIPVMERVLANPAEDRLVRLSAAYGLAESGKPTGVAGLTRIFEESSGDGRERALAFRALTSLNDERALPFMRQLVVSEVEPTYRLQAIRFVTTQGDQQALSALQAVMDAPDEHASVRDAAAQAHRVLSGR